MSEGLANAFYGLSVLLAARNSPHTWWTGIIGCIIFSWVFYHARLYADVLLMQFYNMTSLWGMWHWYKGCDGAPAPIMVTRKKYLAGFAVAAMVVALCYGQILFYYTDAYAPFIDSAVLTFSVLAQILLMQRRIENWPCWIVVNTLAVPLYFSRELYITAGLYTLFWCNAWWGWYQWRRRLHP